MKKLSVDDISVKQMKMFLTVANHRSFSEAADSLFVNQSVISRTIQGMENALNVVLFHRKNHGIELTNQGKELYLELKDFVTEYEDRIRKVQAKKDLAEETIVAGVLNLDDTVDLTKNLIRKYSALRPDVKIDLRSYGMRDLQENMMCGNLHCGFSFKLGMGQMPNVTTDQVVMLESFFCVNAHNKGVQEHSLLPAVLEDEVLILTSVVDFTSPEERALGVCKKYGFQPKQIRYVSTRTDAQMAVKNGEGFAIDGKSFNDRYPDDIICFPITGLKHEQYLVALHREEEKHKPTMEFLQWIREGRFEESDLR